MNPPRITLALRRTCEFGSEISFIPATGMIPYLTPRIAKDLTERINAANEKAKG